MKKICMIVPGFGAKGGIASVVKGYRGSELEQKFNIHYIETYCDGGKAAKLLKALGAYLCFARELILFRPDLIHIHSSFGASFYRKLPFIWLGSLLKIPVVNHIHGSELERFYQDASPIGKKLKKAALQSCAAVIALTDSWKTRFEDTFALQNVAVVKNYGRIIPPSADREEHTVLFMGFLSRLKGCMDIPEIASYVKREIPEVRFVLAGSGSGEDVAKIHELAEQYGVQENLFFPGWIIDGEKDRMLHKAAVFFLPSYTEGMPMSILEAMGYGLPIVSTNVGGIPQLVQQEENGYLCQPGDVQSFADALIRLLQDPQLREEMGKRSLDIVQTGFSLKAHTDGIERVYEEILSPESNKGANRHAPI